MQPTKVPLTVNPPSTSAVSTEPGVSPWEQLSGPKAKKEKKKNRKMNERERKRGNYENILAKKFIN